MCGSLAFVVLCCLFALAFFVFVVCLCLHSLFLFLSVCVVFAAFAFFVCLFLCVCIRCFYVTDLPKTPSGSKRDC